MLASALGTGFLPDHVTKLDAAGALADAPIALATALSRPTSVLAESEIVLEGFLDYTTFLGFRPLPMDPSQGEKWAAARGRGGAAGPTFIDATVPCRLRHAVTRSFRSAMAG